MSIHVLPGQAPSVPVDHGLIAFCPPRAAPAFIAGGLAPWQLRRITEHMAAHLAQDMPLAGLAALVRLSTTHFSRAFKQSTGVSPHRFLIRLRCSRAKELLLEQGLGIAAIASTTGFSDQAHFTRAFGQTVGTPPAAWRRMQRTTRG